MLNWVIILGALGLSGYTFYLLNGMRGRMDRARQDLEKLRKDVGGLRELHKQRLLQALRELPEKARLTIPVVTYRRPNDTVQTNHETPYLTPGVSLLTLAQENGIELATACGGVGNCGMCAVIVHSGAENLAPANAIEQQWLGTLVGENQRLACQCKDVTGNVVLEGVN